MSIEDIEDKIKRRVTKATTDIAALDVALDREDNLEEWYRILNAGTMFNSMTTQRVVSKIATSFPVLGVGDKNMLHLGTEGFGLATNQFYTADYSRFLVNAITLQGTMNITDEVKEESFDGSGIIPLLRDVANERMAQELEAFVLLGQGSLSTTTWHPDHLAFLNAITTAQIGLMPDMTVTPSSDDGAGTGTVTNLGAKLTFENYKTVVASVPVQHLTRGTIFLMNHFSSQNMRDSLTSRIDDFSQLFMQNADPKFLRNTMGVEPVLVPRLPDSFMDRGADKSAGLICDPKKAIIVLFGAPQFKIRLDETGWSTMLLWRLRTGSRWKDRRGVTLVRDMNKV